MSGIGRFIVLEGIDGAGTTTQAGLLVKRLREDSKPAIVTREPSTGPIGNLLRQVLEGRIVVPMGDRKHRPLDQHAMALLFAADRLDHLDVEILPNLRAGTHVVSDRYVLSSMAYQRSFAKGEWVDEINARARIPDLTIFLDVPAEVALKRVFNRKGKLDIYERMDMQKKVAAAYRKLVDTIQGTTVVIDGTLPIEEIAGRIWFETKQIIGAA